MNAYLVSRSFSLLRSSNTCKHCLCVVGLELVWSLKVDTIAATAWPGGGIL